MGCERRRTTRVAFSTTATLHFEDAAYAECATENLSTKGVFIAGVTGRTIGDTCSIELHLSGASSDLVLRMQGRVVRTPPNGIAIQFEEVDLDSFYHLKNIVYYNSEDPDAEERILPTVDETMAAADEFE